MKELIQCIFEELSKYKLFIKRNYNATGSPAIEYSIKKITNLEEQNENKVG